MTPTPTTVPTFAALDAALRDRGFTEGFPDHVTPEARSIDQRAAARLRCPGCKARGLELLAYRRVRGTGYAAVAHCLGCLAAQEV
jgi:hypothetical protein